MENNSFTENEIKKISMFNTNYESQSHFTTTYNIKQCIKGLYLCDDIENKVTRESLNEPFPSGIIEINNSQNIETEEKNEDKKIDNYLKKDNKCDLNMNKVLAKEKIDEKIISNENSIEKKSKKKKFIIKNEKIKKIFYSCKKNEKIKKGKKKNEKKYKPSRQDNDRAMFSRIVLNSYYYNKLSSIIKTYGNYKKKLRKFPHCLIAKISQIHNKEYLCKTLKEIYEDVELFKKKKDENEIDSHYEENLKIIEELEGDKYKEFREKSDFDKMLVMKFRDLIEEYQKTEEYKKKKNEISESKIKFDADKTIYFWDNFIANSA